MESCNSTVESGISGGALSSRFKVFLLVLVVWTGIYLPPLGVFELSFNESRRVYPALTMIETGDWLVPVLEGEKYFKKPPMINWLIAGSFAATGQKSEFAARLPSALCVLALAAVIALMPSGFLGPGARLISSLVFLTSAGIVSKGMICEIEVPYICLTGIAMLVWLNLYSSGAGNFRLWCIPGAILGVCLLIKGPIALLFFYAMVIGVLAASGSMRRIFSLWHIAGIAIMMALFLAWAIPALNAAKAAGEGVSGAGSSGNAAETWMNEMLLQLKTGRIGIGLWFSRVGGSLANFAPWILFLPFFFKPSGLVDDEKALKIFRGCCFGLLAAFLIVNFMPGTKARYTMPLIPLASVLTGLLLSNLRTGHLAFRIWGYGTLAIAAIAAFSSIAVLASIPAGKLLAGRGLQIFSEPSQLSMVIEGLAAIGWFHSLLALGISAAAVFLVLQVWKFRAYVLGSPVCLAIVLSLAVVIPMLDYRVLKPVARKFEKFRPAAEAINTFMPPGGKLTVYKTGIEPFFFYMENPWAKEKSVPADFRGFLLCPEDQFDNILNRKRILREGGFRIKSTVYGLYEL